METYPHARTRARGTLSSAGEVVLHTQSQHNLSSSPQVRPCPPYGACQATDSPTNKAKEEAVRQGIHRST